MKHTNDQAHARSSPHDDNGSIRAKTSANSTIARKTPPPNQVRRAIKDQVNAAPPLHQKCALKAQDCRKSMQQRRVSDYPCRRAQIRRLPDVDLLDVGHGVGPGQHMSTAYSASSVSLSTKPCTVGCALRRRWRFGSRESGPALRARSGISLCVARARLSRHCGSGVIQFAFFS